MLPLAPSSPHGRTVRWAAVAPSTREDSGSVHDGAVDGQQRWARMLALAVEAIGPGPRTVKVEGHEYAGPFADRLAAALRDYGADGADAAAGVTVVTNGTADLLIWLRVPSPYGSRGSEPDADIVVDLHDPDWPVIRHIDP